MANKSGYFRETLHPWPCVLFLLPLLGAYEIGVYMIGGPEARALRNGADAWLRWVLDVYGIKPFLAAPGVVLAIFAIWSIRRWDDRPDYPLQVVTGMWLESLLFAFGLWLLGHNFASMLRAADITLATAEVEFRTDKLTQILTFVGAGIYEEVLFRLFVITGIAAMLKCAFVPNWASALLAGVASALLFAAAHHIGPYGEPMDAYRFVYRTTAGVYFALIFWYRGFGVAVGTHALYDILVGVRMG
ncbi:MAG: CPBP family intramembrane metalloprotease [Planctomycetes bacterium]|nr:CPBP family intramembrane metalloprotease [Planctomycetota bacterium]